MRTRRDPSGITRTWSLSSSSLLEITKRSLILCLRLQFRPHLKSIRPVSVHGLAAD